MSSVVVIGAGLAGARAVETLRDLGYAGSITLLGNEGLAPYERPALSKRYLQGRKDAGSLAVHSPDWYADHDVEVRWEDAAVGLDAGARLVRLASGRTIQFAHALLATGARARRLDVSGLATDGVHVLRTLADSTSLREALTPGRKVVIVGGGWLGLEVAAAARRADCSVVVLERGPLPLQGVLGEQLARHFAALHRHHGVDLRTNASVLGVASRSGRVTAVRTTHATIPADVVLVAAGAVPNTELAERAGLAVDGGVVVDEHLRSSAPAILAAGDVANAWHAALGTRLRVEHWDNAIRQGRLAAHTILGRPEVYDWQPYFFTDQFDLGMEYVGYADSGDEVVIRGDMSSGAFIAFWLRAGRVRAAMNVNTWKVNHDLRALIGLSIPAERLRDPGVDLRELVPSPQLAS